jgi:RNA polymerase sigma factor (sigma-70 family)
VQTGEQPADPTAAAAALTTHHVRRAVDGDRASLEWLAGRLTPLLVAQVAYRMGPALRSTYDAEDLVQDAWLVILPRLDDLVARGGRLTPVLLEFMSRTLRHTVRNLMRKQARAGEATRTPVESVAADASGVVTRACRGELRSLVREHIQELDPIDREVLIVRGVEQLPNRAAAALLGLGPSALAMRYRRALDRLRDALPGSVFAELVD